MTHVISLRKNSLAKNSAHKALSDRPKRRPWEQGPICPVTTLVATVCNDFVRRLPVEHAATASLSASWACRCSKSKASRCGEHCKIISRTSSSPGEKLAKKIQVDFDLFLGSPGPPWYERSLGHGRRSPQWCVEDAMLLFQMSIHRTRFSL